MSNTSWISATEKPQPSVPWMTITLALLCLLGRAAYGFLEPLQRNILVQAAGANPAEIAQLLERADGLAGLGGLATMPLALFIHSSWPHVAGNLAYLWVFGLPVERRLGPFSLALVFLLGGVLANLVLALQVPSADLPVIGASGAVSAVLGACFGLFPDRRMGLYLPLGFFVQFAQVPSVLVIGSWFILQLVYTVFGPTIGALAWWTHLAGFMLGLVFALIARALLQLWPRW